MEPEQARELAEAFWPVIDRLAEIAGEHPFDLKIAVEHADEALEGVDGDVLIGMIRTIFPVGDLNEKVSAGNVLAAGIICFAAGAEYGA